MLNSVPVELTERLARLAGGFQFVEGPVWQLEAARLLFNDIPADTAYAWSDESGLTVTRHPTNKANGQVIDPFGRLIVCEHRSSSLVWIGSDGERTVIASHYEDRELNSPNDVIAAPNGSVIFTDPPFGRTESAMGELRPRELGFCGVYECTKSDDLRLLSTQLAEPNGLCLSLDQARLYVNDTATGRIIEFKTSWGSGGPVLDEGREFARVPSDASGKADGMKVDALNNVWCTGAGGIHVFNPAGRPIGMIEVPEPVGNFAWGGLDGRDLYVTASTSLYRARTSVPGAAWV